MGLLPSGYKRFGTTHASGCSRQKGDKPKKAIPTCRDEEGTAYGGSQCGLHSQCSFMD
jgi:hypothetical protein